MTKRHLAADVPGVDTTEEQHTHDCPQCGFWSHIDADCDMTIRAECYLCVDDNN